MINQTNADVGCRLVGEFVDEAELPPDGDFHHGEVVSPRIAANYIDEWTGNGVAAENLSRALLRVVQEETHAPSRAQIVESLVRLQAVIALREVLSQTSPADIDLQTSAVQALAQLFALTGNETRLARSPKEGQAPLPANEAGSKA